MASAYKKFFNSMIWSRGNAYYEANRVTSLSQSNNTWLANVQGTSPYIVSFTTAPVTMNCTCPYAKDGNQCKHMAAAFIAYENRGESSKVVKQNSVGRRSLDTYNSLESCEWFRFIKASLNKTGYVSDAKFFNHGIERYVIELEQEDKRDLYKHRHDVFSLISFINKNYEPNFFGADRLYSRCLEVLYDIRMIVDFEKKKKLDERTKSIFLKSTSKDLALMIIDYYFMEDDDYGVIEEFLKAKKSIKIDIDEIMDLLTNGNQDEEKLERLCVKFQDYKSVRAWLAEYYLDSGLYEKGVKFLENYCYNEANINQDIISEQYDLFCFYTKLKRTSSRNAMFDVLLKNRKANKRKLFLTYKEGMSDEEWIQSGKQIVRDWTKGRNNEICYEIFYVLNEADIMFEKMINDGYDADALYHYHTMLSNYDEGMLYTMYKILLKDELTSRPYSISWVLSEFVSKFPSTENANRALRMILIDLQDEYRKDERICSALEKMEESVYEESFR